MDGKALAIFLGIGLLAGFLASLIVGGGFVLGAVGVNLGIKDPLVSQIVTSTIGAIIVVVLARLIA